MKKLILISLALFFISSFAYAAYQINNAGSTNSDLCLGCPYTVSGFFESGSAGATYWETARAAYWPNTRVSLWTTPRNTEIP